MDALHWSISAGTTSFLDTEFEKNGCPLEKNTDLKYDPRYHQTGFSTDEYSLRRDSGVLDYL